MWCYFLLIQTQNTNRNMELNQDTDHESNNLVVRIDQDSDNDLQALFDTVLKPDSNRPLQVPLRMRNLPKSFFDPPSTGSKSPSISHSRENSADSASGSAGDGVPAVGLQVAHSRAHSSPASLQQTYAVGQQQSGHHTKQRSYDDPTSLPPGWEQARTPEGQIYYLNHITRTTTWEDPRKNQQQQQNIVSQQVQPVSAANKSSVVLGPLPDGWEQATSPEGLIYFINHQTRSTSWFDPRIPIHLQRSPRPGALLPQSTWLNPLSSSVIQATQQKMRLQSLQMERDRLKQRQQEIRRQQELMLRGNRTDPFLSGLADHARQESADSGLGMGPTYSLPCNPEDILANIDNVIDNMDCVSEGGVSTNMDTTDVSTLNDNIDSTDDLVPNMFADVQSLINPNTTKTDNVLTWL